MLFDESLPGFEGSLWRPHNLRGAEGNAISKKHFIAPFNGSSSTTKASAEADLPRMDCLQPSPEFRQQWLPSRVAIPCRSQLHHPHETCPFGKGDSRPCSVRPAVFWDDDAVAVLGYGDNLGWVNFSAAWCCDRFLPYCVCSVVLLLSGFRS